MKTGNYRVRKGWFGRAILQAEYDGPSYIGGHVDASIRIKYWRDCAFKDISHMNLKQVFPSPLQEIEAYPQRSYGFPTWTCHSCGDERPDALIAVLTYPLAGFGGMAERNWRYCKDRPACLEKAQAAARSHHDV